MATLEVILVTSASSDRTGLQMSPSGSWLRVMSPSLIRAVPRQYRGPGRESRSTPAVVSVLASASVVLLDAPSDLARSLSERPSGGPSAIMLISRMALATLRTVYRSCCGSLSASALGDWAGPTSNAPPAYKCSVVPNDNV